MDYVAMCIGNDLNFDVPWEFDRFLQIDRRIAKGVYVAAAAAE